MGLTWVDGHATLEKVYTIKQGKESATLKGIVEAGIPLLTFCGNDIRLLRK